MGSFLINRMSKIGLYNEYLVSVSILSAKLSLMIFSSLNVILLWVKEAVNQINVILLAPRTKNPLINSRILNK